MHARDAQPQHRSHRARPSRQPPPPASDGATQAAFEEPPRQPASLRGNGPRAARPRVLGPACRSTRPHCRAASLSLSYLSLISGFVVSLCNRRRVQLAGGRLPVHRPRDRSIPQRPAHTDPHRVALVVSALRGHQPAVLVHSGNPVGQAAPDTAAGAARAARMRNSLLSYDGEELTKGSWTPEVRLGPAAAAARDGGGGGSARAADRALAPAGGRGSAPAGGQAGPPQLEPHRKGHPRALWQVVPPQVGPPATMMPATDRNGRQSGARAALGRRRAP